MKSLIFCTSYIRDHDEWENRYQKWIDYYAPLPFSKNKDIFLIDDGTEEEYLKSFRGNRYNEKEGLDHSPAHVNLYRFKERLGINPEDNLPGLYGSTLGWYRSFFFSYELAQKYNYDKIIHIESDAYLLTQKICDYIDSIDKGWSALYCPMYYFPETSFQIICKDQFNTLSRLFHAPIENFRTSQAEKLLPFTHIEKGFIGDRYGERTTKQFPKMDYYNQCNSKTKLKFTN